MARPIKKTYVMIASDANGISTTQTPTGAGNLTITGALASGGSVTLTVGQHVTITSDGVDTTRVFTVTGTDNDDKALTETITGVNATTVAGTSNFKTITQIAVDAATAGAITAGIEGSAEFDWIPLDRNITPFEFAYQVDLGTATLLVESTLDDIQDSSATIGVTTDAVEASGSSDVSGVSTIPTMAVRVKVTAFTSGNIVFKLLQAGIRQ